MSRPSHVGSQRYDVLQIVYWCMSVAIASLILSRIPSFQTSTPTTSTGSSLSTGAVQSPYSLQHPAYAADAVANLTAWRSTLFKRISESRGNRPSSTRGKNHWWFSEFDGFVRCPPGTKITGYGRGKGIKWTCGYPVNDPKCVIYSLGSNMDFSFEQDVLNKTLCQVHTFDCSCNGKSIHPRHTFHKICIGSAKFVYSRKPGTVSPVAMSLPQIAQMLNHTTINAMKMDIEGSEFETLSEWLATDATLPLQLNLELHYKRSHLYKVKDDHFDVPLFLGHLTQLGYAIGHKENNPDSHRCTELLLLRVQTFDGIRVVKLPHNPSFSPS